MRTFSLMLVMVLLSSGCAHKFTQQDVEAALSKGKTTKQVVLAIFGEPYRKDKTPGMKIVSGGKEQVLHTPVEIWLYSSHQVALFEMLEPKTLRVIFDTDGIVSNFDYHEDGV
jgi:uncharacterized GH25 family protein